MKRLSLSLSLLFLCLSIAHAQCFNLQNDRRGLCADSSDCLFQCGLVLSRASLNPLLPGFLAGFVDRQLTVIGVIPHSPASEAGMAVGDRLIAVDDVHLPNSFGREVWQKPGEHNLTVERSGRTVHFYLTPESEEDILAKAWSDFDPVAQKSLELVGFTKRRRPASMPILRKPFLSGLKIVSAGQGFTVEKVLPGSAAEEAGIRAGDIIVHSNTNEIVSSDSRTTVDLTLRRGDKTFSLTLQMTSVSEILRAPANKRQATGNFTNAGL